MPGFPDCVQPSLFSMDEVEKNALTLQCSQRPKDFAAQISVGCVGDSITAVRLIFSCLLLSPCILTGGS